MIDEWTLGLKTPWEKPQYSPSPDTLLLLPSGIGVPGVESWAHKLADIA